MSSLREVEKKKRTVFRPLLDNPFPQTQFPTIEPSIQLQILEYLLILLDEIHKYEEINKSKSKMKPQEPDCYVNVTLGFNSTVKQLENQAKVNYRGTEDKKRKKKKGMGSPSENKENSMDERKKISYVFVCKADITPALLVQQFPVLCFTASTEEHKVKLIQLPRGSIDKIEQKLGKKISIIGLYHYESISKSFKELLDKVDDLSIPWLENVEFMKPKIKVVETSAPIKPKKQKTK